MICISLISLVLSTTTTLSKNPSSFTLNPGDSSTLNISYSIVNTAFSGAKGVTIVGSPKFLTYSGGSIAYIENTTTTEKNSVLQPKDRDFYLENKSSLSN